MFAHLFTLFADAAQEFEIFSPTKSYMADFANMAISLAIVIALLFATLWVLKRIMRSRLTYLNDTSAIRVLEKRILNQKAALYLVEVMGKGVLISESTAGIQMLSTVEGEEWEAELAALDAPETEASQEKVGFLNKLIKGHG